MGGKKKGRRQSDPAREDAESTDDETVSDPVNLTSCPHTGKAVALAAIKKNLKISWVRVGQCAPCLKEKKMSGRATTLPRDNKPAGKRTMQDIKKEQLERAREEQIKAAAKLKKTAEPPPPADHEKPPEQDTKVENPAVTADGIKLGPEEAAGGPASVWLCLKCGSQACGANSKNHLAVHYKTPRSDLHCLFVNTESWAIFCFECNKDIYIDSHKKLYEAVEFIKKTNTKPNKQMAAKSMMGSLPVPKLSGKDAKDQTNSAVQAGLLPKVKGLNNLGNTCFFNSVMQCLSQTHPLTQLIDIQSSKGASFSVKVENLDEGVLSEDENDNLGLFTIPDLSVQLQEGGPMMTSLAAFLKEMHSAGKTSTISPSHLFGQVVKQSPKFRGMQQQDSQELLRYLLDGLRNEEAKRQKTAVLKYFGFSEKTDPKTVPRNIRKKLKLYGRMSSHTLLDKLFSGQMVSTIVCEECHYSSQTYESFLDLSLPVVEDKPHKPRSSRNPEALPDDDDNVRVTCCGAQDSRKSKGQLKKDKHKRKKDSRRSVRSNNLKNTGGEDKIQADIKENETKTITERPNLLKEAIIAKPVIKPENKKPTIPKPEAKADKGTEDKKKAKEDRNKDKQQEGGGGWKDGGDDEEEEEGYEEGEEDWEWDYGETWEEEGKEKNKSDEEEDSDYVEPDAEPDQVATSPDSIRSPSVPLQSLNPLPPELISAGFEHEQSCERTASESTGAETGASSNADIEDNDSDDSKVRWTNSTNVMDNLSRLDPVDLNPSNLDPHMEELCKNIQLLNVNKNGDDVISNDQPAKSGLQEEDGDTKEGLSAGEARLQRLRNEWTARTLVSLAPRYESSPGECSVYSCLNQFSQSELLTGSNKWACDACTKLRARADESDSSSDKTSKKSSTVYTNASKQILIFSPPTVLTLHLRRYQQTLVGCRKINKHVSFPLILDLAPFCSSTSLAMPIMQPHQPKVLYSLYGVVEHSGRLQGGHYVAFIKVRAANTISRDFSQFFTSPVSKPSDIPRLFNQLQEKLGAESPKDGEPVTPDAPSPPAKRWFQASDSNVTEVSEDRVLKAQAYLLFYERIL